jgi:beta-glucosidase
MVARVLAPYYRLGQDQGYPPVNFNVQQSGGNLNLGVSVRSDPHTALAREIASASAVLLKNSGGNGVTKGLPLNKANIKTMAVVGIDARMPKKDCDALNKCNEGTMSIGWGSGTNSVEFLIPPIDAIKQYTGKETTITESLSNDLNAGVAAARGKDAALVFVFAWVYFHLFPPFLMVAPGTDVINGS